MLSSFLTSQLASLWAHSPSLYPWLLGGSHLQIFHWLLQAMAELQLLPVVDTSELEARQLAVVVELELVVNLYVESIAF